MIAYLNILWTIAHKYNTCTIWTLNVQYNMNFKCGSTLQYDSATGWWPLESSVYKHVFDALQPGHMTSSSKLG